MNIHILLFQLSINTLIESILMIVMIFQINFWGSLIGSGIATLFSIGAWASIKQLEKILKKRKDNRNFSKLYRLFSKDSLLLYLASEIVILVNEIGDVNIFKVLKLVREENVAGFFLNNEKYRINITYKLGKNSIIINEGSSPYDYANPSENLPIKESLLNYFEQQCKNEKIKLKK